MQPDSESIHQDAPFQNVLTEQNEDILHIVEEEISVMVVGKYVGQCKWFNDLLGYGFVTICEGTDKGKDIFVHHTGIQPLNSNYKTLRKGEYLNFNIVTGVNGLQAVNVTGINGGPLMCDFVSVNRAKTDGVENTTKHMNMSTSPGNAPAVNGKFTPNNISQWYVVTKSGRRKNLAKYSKEGRLAMKQAKEQGLI